MEDPVRLLVVGATGYMYALVTLVRAPELFLRLILQSSGGSILTTLLASRYPSIRNLSISVLVRSGEQGKVFAEKGVNPIYFKDLDDVDRIRSVASDYDGLSTAFPNARAYLSDVNKMLSSRYWRCLRLPPGLCACSDPWPGRPQSL